jgi:formate dehydrogenase iron-sulfur subunit
MEDGAVNRRTLLRLGLAGAATGAMPSPAAASSAEAAATASPNYVGVLADTTLCIGCRKCEEACAGRNHLPRLARSFADRDILRTFRRPTATAFTVVNMFQGSPSRDQAALSSTYVKAQCMHCLQPSCVSACIVGALTKAPDGAVVYNPTICLGCRYCQVACPFEVPAYEFNEPLKPRVRKCELCTDHAAGTGANPACAASCPTEALVFGRRADLLALAKDRLKRRPDRYLDHIYGETEVGGTSWLYLTGRPVEQIGMLRLQDRPPRERTEAIQHGIFKYGALPVAFYGLLYGLMWYHNREKPDPPAGGPAGEPVGAGTHAGGGK